ncbi:cellulose 1,4-beta-cellobiosidase [Actinoallomurus bryophytorum]|uniref:Glucanase n=1 Tax=Actinoallomurus bryophytorum TaxID=1490222 RepID=A0A543C063_9ACTN|nr:glycoside hydrolase family 6 protein [Actinoallomurus bryophytorum]TQL90470.1 cellulose 1,4-beta-cellobiosidase [Actinoallomurus bryophytorum]
MKVNVHRPRASRSVVTALSALLLGLVATLITIGSAHAAAGCKVTYGTNDWGGGFTANLGITNLGDPVTSWTLEWDFAGNQQVGQGWSGTFTQSSKHVTVKSLSYNGALATNASTSLGFNGSYSGTNTAPTTFKLNGTTCDGTAGSTPTPTPTPTPTDPGDGGSHAANPFAGGKGYVNPEWSAEAKGDGGTAVANQPTAVWLDRIAAINGVNGGMGLRAHLDAAVSQGAGYAQFVIYDLPGRDCAALASNGELGATDIGRYQSEYIDPIASIMADSKYANLKIITYIEPDSLPNLVTNVSGNTATAACQTMQQNGNYVKGVQYALNKLHAISNVYTYIDAAHHGWLGWDSNFNPAAQLFATVAKGTTAGVNSVDGFVVNTANYSPTTEPYLPVNDQTRQSKWVDWNYYVDESSFGAAFRQQLIADGFSSGIGMVIDTSRNGWGGSSRPTGPSTASDINTQVNAERVDRRPHVGDWCNQSGAGLGARPAAAPATGFDAYAWVKPPGESDGSSSAISNDEGKGFDRMCDPTYGGNALNGNSPSGALANAPLSGHWFSAQFHQLLQNAYPAVS